ncbi:pre-mRNA-splicing factor CWC25 -like protein [Brachionus plicatilis]|uniref:Pre-mRNA-splicing factor CWC25-like protein n=1 Tax=Brachionus plicatilis TaxID=10195 RepID=A0A3M7RHM7_BRAPC|nr:pre-mRNA-splicing factor CWC25 -like protein [Brachionus plicatilis]
MSKKMQTIDPAERSKIARLQSEIKQESDKKIEWLYSGNKIDRDAYLLGRPINKLLIEKEQDESQQSQFQASTIDMENKIREDPLFEIKKQEIQAKKKILENPLKMKQIEQMINNNNIKISKERLVFFLDFLDSLDLNLPQQIRKL